jgi:hypothetical protein
MGWRRRSVLVRAAVLAVALSVCAGYASAQFFGRGTRSPVRLAPEVFPDGDFVVCRLMYTEVRSEPNGGGWRTDYPLGEINLTIRFSELTRTPVSWAGTASARVPNHWVVRPTDDALFQCPFVIASDVGTIGLRDDEALRLREYLLKGGFLWVDDFWGPLAAGDRVRLADVVGEPPRPVALLPVKRLELVHAHPQRRPGGQHPLGDRPGGRSQVLDDAPHGEPDRDPHDEEVDRPEGDPERPVAGIPRHGADCAKGPAPRPPRRERSCRRCPVGVMCNGRASVRETPGQRSSASTSRKVQARRLAIAITQRR